MASGSTRRARSRAAVTRRKAGRNKHRARWTFWRPNRFLQIPSAPDVPGLRLPARLRRPPIAGVEQCGPQRKSTDNTRNRCRLHVFLVGKRCAVRRTAVRCGPARRIASARLAGTTPDTTSDNGTYHSAPNCGVLLHLTTTGGQSPKTSSRRTSSHQPHCRRPCGRAATSLRWGSFSALSTISTSIVALLGRQGCCSSLSLYAGCIQR